jgi:hypothetical protein
MGIALKAVYSLGTLSFPENETTCRASKMQGEKTNLNATNLKSAISFTCACLITHEYIRWANACTHNQVVMLHYAYDMVIQEQKSDVKKFYGTVYSIMEVYRA